MTSESVQQEELGFAGKLAKSFIQSPLSPLLFLAMLGMGMIGLIATPRQEDPEISVPLIDLFLSYPGASAKQVESLAINPLERAMSEIPGVKHVYSVSQREQGIVTIQFKVGEKIGESLVKVHDKLQSNLDKVPPGVERPLVKGKGSDDVPVVNITLWSKTQDGGNLRRLALNVLQQLNQVPNTGQGFVVGGRGERIRIDIQPERLAGFGISLDQVAAAIRSANRESGIGNIEAGNQSLQVYAGGFLKNARDVGQLVVGSSDGSPVMIADISKIYAGLAEPEDVVTFTTGPAYGDHHEETEGHADHAAPNAYAEQAVTIAIAKKVGSNGVDVANGILKKIEVMKKRVIPPDVHVDVTRNYGATASDKVNELLFKLVVVTAVVGGLVWLALGLRPAIVVTLVIPVVILMTIFSAYLMGYSINRVSLFGLIFSIGILVDDAIVVVENIYRRWLIRGETDVATAVDAVREIGGPTILATFTVIAALLPMAFVSGMMGPYMSPIPVLGSIAMLVSVFCAFAFATWLTYLFRPSIKTLKKMEEREHRTDAWLEKVFQKILPPLIDDKKKGRLFLFGLIAAFFLACLMFYSTALPVKMLPYDNKSEFNVVLDMPEGTALPLTHNLALKITDKIREIPEVTAVESYTGTAQPFDFNGMVRHYYLRSQPWQAELHVLLVDKHHRSRSSHEIAQVVRDMVTPIASKAGARLTVAEAPPGPPVMQAVVAEIYGPDAETRRQVAQDMTAFFDNEPGLADVDNYAQQPHDIWRFDIDTEKAVRHGISADTVIRNLSMAMSGFKVADIKTGSDLEPNYIVIQVPLAIRAQPSRLEELPIPSQTGTSLALGELGKFVRIPQDAVIYHKDLRSVEYVVADAVGRLGAPIYPMLSIDEKLKDYETPDGVTISGFMTGPPEDDAQSAFSWTGEWTITYETFRDMGIAFAVALVLIYMLVVGLFGTFLVPAIIMAPIPLTLLGIVPGHLIMGAQFTATSMIGFIALAGIIVRNSILMVDFAMQEINTGSSVREAVLASCKSRTRPIVITALALVGDSVFILGDPIFQGMAVSLLFGVVVSTILTLIVIPLGCVSLGSKMGEQKNQPENAVLSDNPA